MREKECIESCKECSKSCDQCSIDKNGEASAHSIVCSEFCALVKSLTEKGICPKEVYELCAKICDNCAESCEKEGSKCRQDCAKVCKKCAEHCRRCAKP